LIAIPSPIKAHVDFLNLYMKWQTFCVQWMTTNPST